MFSRRKFLRIQHIIILLLCTYSIAEIKLPADHLGFKDIPLIITDSTPVVVDTNFNSAFIHKVAVNKTYLTIGADAHIRSCMGIRK